MKRQRVLVAWAVLASLALLSADPPAAEPEEIRLTPGAALEKADPWMPAAFSPDGRKVLFVRRPGDGTTWAVLANADGTEPKPLIRISAREDPGDGVRGYLIQNVGPNSFSKDGLRNLVPARRDVGDANERAGPCVLSAGKKPVWIESGSATSSFAFAGSRIAYLKTSEQLLIQSTGEEEFAKKKKDYELRVTEGKGFSLVHKSDREWGAYLRANPAGTKVAFYVFSSAPGRPYVCKIRVVDLATKAAVDTGELSPVDKAPFNDQMTFHWDAEGKGIFYNTLPLSASMGQHAPFSLCRFDVETKKTAVLQKDDNTGVVGVLDKGHLAVMKGRGYSTFCVYRIADKAFFPFPTDHRMIACAGRRVVVTKGEKVFTAAIEIPGEAATPEEKAKRPPPEPAATEEPEGPAEPEEPTEPKPPAIKKKPPPAKPPAEKPPAGGSAARLVGEWKVAKREGADASNLQKMAFRADGSVVTTESDGQAKTLYWQAAGDAITLTRTKGAAAAKPTFKYRFDGESLILTHQQRDRTFTLQKAGGGAGDPPAGPEAPEGGR